MITLQDMAVAYLNNVGEEINRYKGIVAQHQSHLDSLEEHFAECQAKLAEDTSDKLKTLSGGLANPTSSSNNEPIEYLNKVDHNQEPSINDQYK